MAWWDHEELKGPKHRSDRYIVSFPDGYTKDEVASAQRRLDKQKTQYGRQDMTDTDPVTVPDEAAELYAENIRLTARVKKLNKILDTAQDFFAEIGVDAAYEAIEAARKDMERT